MEEMLCQQRAAVIQKQQALKRIEAEDRAPPELAAGCTACGVGSGDTDATSRDPDRWMENPLKLQGFLDLEVPIRQMDQSDVEAVVFLGKVGVGISEEHLRARQTSIYDGAFLILDQEDVYSGEDLHPAGDPVCAHPVPRKPPGSLPAV